MWSNNNNIFYYCLQKINVGLWLLDNLSSLEVVDNLGAGIGIQLRHFQVLVLAKRVYCWTVLARAWQGTCWMRSSWLRWFWHQRAGRWISPPYPLATWCTSCLSAMAWKRPFVAVKACTLSTRCIGTFQSASGCATPASVETWEKYSSIQ